MDLAAIPGDREAFSRLSAACKRHSDNWLHEVLDIAESISPQLHITRAMLNWSELAEMQQSGTIDVGSHTRTHQRLLAGLDPVVMENEIVGSCREIEERLGIAPALFCYPNGDLTAAAESMVARTYAGAVTTRSGINSVGTQRASLHRIGMHEDASRTRSQFLARLAGWL